MNQDWRQWVTFFLAVLMLMFGWQWYMAKKYGKPNQATQSTDTATDQQQPQPAAPAAPPQGQPAAPTLAASGDWHVALASPGPEVVLGSREKDSGYKAQIRFAPVAAAIEDAWLSEFKWHVDDKHTGYPIVAAGQDSQGITRYPLELGQLKLAGRQEMIPLGRDCWQFLDLDETSDDAATVRYEARVLDQDEQTVLRVLKEYRYAKENYELQLTLRVVNESASPVQVESLEVTGPLGLLREDPRSDRRRAAVAAFWRGGAAEKETELTVERQQVSESKPSASIEKPAGAQLRWWGAVNKFFAAVTRPIGDEKGQAVEWVRGESITAQLYTVTTPDDQESLAPGVAATLGGAPAFAPGNEQIFTLATYLGPIDKNVFDLPQYANLHYNKLYSGGACCTFCAFDWLTLLLLKLMEGVHAVVGNYGIAIIILVALVRLVLHPITKRSQVHMMKMGKIGPKMQELKEKYGDNKQEFQRKQFEIMKEHGLTGGMLLGCLPMFLQFPIWIALYTAVDANVALRHQGLLPASWHWLTDLCAPDRLVPLSVFGVEHPVTIPLLSGFMGPIDAFNLLPILLAIGMYLQSKLMGQTQAAANPQAAQQQKMMQVMMPIMMLLFLYTAPSGLNLYIMTSTFVGLIEQRIIRKHLKEQEEKTAEAKVTTTTKLSSKLGRKKPKERPPKRYF